MPKIRKLAYQEVCIRKIDHFRGRALIADEMGLGKTVEALLWIKKYPEKRPVIIVCPATLKWMWESFVHDILKKRCDVLCGETPPKKGLIGKHSIIIINYDILQYWLPYLKKLKAKILVLDECHYLKTRTSIRTESAGELAKGIRYILALSGTPLTNRPAELWPTLHILRPKQFRSFTLFSHRYCQPKMRPWGWEHKGATNIKELHRRLKSLVMIRRLKKDVLQELPDKSRYVIPLEIKDRKEYNEAVNNFIRWLTKKSISKAKRANKAKRLVQIGYLKRLAAQLKMEGVLSWIDDFLEESNGKLVLFAVHKDIIKILHDKYKRKCVVVDGNVTGLKRKRAVRDFQTNKGIRLFIGNIQAAGVGITLTAASTLAFVEMDFVPGNHTQAEDRIHRIGQKNAADIYYLIAKGTIEENLCELIQKKQKILAATLDGTAKTNQLNIFDALEKSLRKGNKK